MIVWIILFVAFFLHLGFAVGELFPWDPPLLLANVIKKRNDGAPEEQKVLTSPGERRLVSIVVHNAGIYNLIVAAGFLWGLFPDHFGNALDERGIAALRLFFLGGAVVAGLFGLTLSKWTSIQAAVGFAGIVAILAGN
jgi:uncharacterized membrane protein